MNQAYQVKIDMFEGPLDLLLHLINQYEIDIYDIPVAQITDQYLDYIHQMERLELNIASEYLVMAATLLALKSQMLLPRQEIDEDIDEYEEDPREELVQRLITYQKYKEAAQHLEDQENHDRQIFMRSPVIFDELDIKPEIVPGEVSVYDMLRAVERMIDRKKWYEPLTSKIERNEIPIEDRMEEMIDIVKEAKDGVLFDKLFVYPTKSHIVVTFLALLELMKNNVVYCKQESHFDDLYVFYYHH